MFEPLTDHIEEIRGARERLDALSDPYDARMPEVTSWESGMKAAGLDDPLCISTLESFGVDLARGWTGLDVPSLDYRVVLALLFFIGRANRLDGVTAIDAVRSGLLEALLENLTALDVEAYAASRAA